MKNFSHGKILVRKTNDLTIVFYDERTVYVAAAQGLYVFERWFVQQSGFYGRNFKPFTDRLKRVSSLNLKYICELALDFNISFHSVGQLPKINRRVEFISSSGRNRTNQELDDEIIKEIIFGRKR